MTVPNKKSLLRELAETFIIAVIAVMIVRVFLIQAYRIPSSSMEKTLSIGDFLLVNKFIYGARVPMTDLRLPKIRSVQPGDVIIFKNPENLEYDYIKRCVAVSGQTVEIKNKELYIDGNKFSDPEHLQHIYGLMPKGIPDPDIFPEAARFNRDNYGPYTVPEGHLFVLGDNRDNSLDSRYWGPLPVENVVGKALLIYWSWDFREPFLKKVASIRWSRIGDIIH